MLMNICYTKEMVVSTGKIMNKYKDYKLKSGNILRIIQDQNAESPNDRGNDNIFLVYEHRQFTVKREGFEPRDIFDYINNKDIDDEISGESPFINYFIFTVYVYIYSGVSLSLSNTEYPFTDQFLTKYNQWDVSTSGFVLIKKNQELTKDQAMIDAQGLVDTWNQYLSGDIYGFQILKPYKTYTISENKLEEYQEYKPYRMGSTNIIPIDVLKSISDEKEEYEEIDSCWGFYGSNLKTNGILDHINDKIIKSRKK